MCAFRGLPVTPRGAYADAATPHTGAGSDDDPDDAGPSSGRRRGRAPKRKRKNADTDGASVCGLVSSVQLLPFMSRTLACVAALQRSMLLALVPWQAHAAHACSEQGLCRASKRLLHCLYNNLRSPYVCNAQRSLRRRGRPAARSASCCRRRRRSRLATRRCRR
jgi:hypothetical protein